MADQSTLLSTINNIKQCSLNLASWSRAKFGSLTTEIKTTHQRIVAIHIAQDQSNDNEELKVMERKLNDFLYKEEVFWKQRSRELWLQAGDQNTKNFHQRAKKKNKINSIKGLLNEENEWIQDEDGVNKIIQKFYQSLFTSSSPNVEKIEELLGAVNPIVTEEMNRKLEKDFSMKEVKNSVFSIAADKSPGPDGMNAMFYQHFWDIVGMLVSKAVLDCLNGEADLVSINGTLVTLISKVNEPRKNDAKDWFVRAMGEEDYELCDISEMINFNKSILFFSPNTTEDIRSIFVDDLNMQTTEVIETYLRLPMMGIPEGQCQEFEKLMARYWWGSVESKQKIHWKAWKDINVPKSEDSKEGSCPLTWRGICWGKELLKKGLRKRIGNGQDTNAFNDPWLPRPPSFLPITKYVNDNLKVSELIQLPGMWNNGLIQQIYLSLDAQLISIIPLSPLDHTDLWMWHYSMNGNYSVRSGYNLALNANTTSHSSSDTLSSWWRMFWEIRIPRKILIFGWRGFQEILSTTKGLLRRHITNHSNFPVCGFGEDSNAHAVFWCPFAQEVWESFEYPFMRGGKDDISFKEVLFYASDLLEKEMFERMLIIAWGIWTERNKKTHGQQQRSAQQIKIWLTMYYEEIRNVNVPERKMLLKEDLTQEEQVEAGL
ncbi:uncharacterized protein LOC141685541 [Apium graveolens]|uniref:uncharacterized protein LOC141685541 n=1 Tax=Apium graveolens TaxID=4045 RepID=UPI003D7C0051